MAGREELVAFVDLSDKAIYTGVAKEDQTWKAYLRGKKPLTGTEVRISDVFICGGGSMRRVTVTLQDGSKFTNQRRVNGRGAFGKSADDHRVVLRSTKRKKRKTGAPATNGTPPNKAAQTETVETGDLKVTLEKLSGVVDSDLLEPVRVLHVQYGSLKELKDLLPGMIEVRRAELKSLEDIQKAVS